MYFELTEREALDLQGVVTLARFGGNKIKDYNRKDKRYYAYIDGLLRAAEQLEAQLQIALDMAEEEPTNG